MPHVHHMYISHHFLPPTARVHCTALYRHSQRTPTKPSLDELCHIGVKTSYPWPIICIEFVWFLLVQCIHSSRSVSIFRRAPIVNISYAYAGKKNRTLVKWFCTPSGVPKRDNCSTTHTSLKSNIKNNIGTKSFPPHTPTRARQVQIRGCSLQYAVGALTDHHTHVCAPATRKGASQPSRRGVN